MPLAHDTGLISLSLKQFRECYLSGIKATGIVCESVDVSEFPSQDTGSGRAGKGIGRVTVVHPDAFVRNPVHIRGLEKVPAIAGHCLGCVVVRHDEDDVRTLLLTLPDLAAGWKDCRCQRNSAQNL